jgi:hypothetical protein
MKTSNRIAKKRKRLKYTEITAAVLLIIAVAAALIIYYNPNPPTVTKPEATEYFSFSDLGALYEYKNVTGTNSVIRIKELIMTLTPVKGNATNVNIFPPGYTGPENTAALSIENGTSKSFDMALQLAYQSIKNGTTYPVKIKISSDQAAGYVTLQIPENSTGPY